MDSEVREHRCPQCGRRTAPPHGTASAEEVACVECAGEELARGIVDLVSLVERLIRERDMQ